MASVIYTPTEERTKGSDFGRELQAFLEAMSLLEFGMLPSDVKKIA